MGAEGTAVATESSYAYTARDGSCKSSFTTAIPQGGVTGYSDVGNSASSLKSALNSNPVSVAIQADQSVFQQYTGCHHQRLRLQPGPWSDGCWLRWQHHQREEQ